MSELTEKKPPTIAELQERIDITFKEVLEKIAGRPFTDGTMDDLRLELAARGLKVVDKNRERFHVDERVYSRAVYELNHFRGVASYLTKVCAENGFDMEIRAMVNDPPAVEPKTLTSS